jgi:hypothetical protein
MCPAGEIGWSGIVKDKRSVAVVHITKVERIKKKGLYSYFLPSRIGIDFYHRADYPHGSPYYTPNLELGDVARLIRILELLKSDKTLNDLASGKIEPFTIGLAFEKSLERRITIGAKSLFKRVTFKYEAVHNGVPISIKYDFTREGIEKFINVLKKVTIEYVNFILRYVLLDEIDPKFR